MRRPREADPRGGCERARGGPAAAGEAWRLQGGEGASSRREGERSLREEGEAARGGGGAPVWIPHGSIERKGALPVGSVERKGKEMCEGE